mmetsp:Transcript_33493/g.83388  ORF Transcript_33493/g.83388 Transcript_33493/m.83388 type:complete len:99 (-) Transcript_33493:437-733(-)
MSLDMGRQRGTREPSPEGRASGHEGGRQGQRSSWWWAFGDKELVESGAWVELAHEADVRELPDHDLGGCAHDAAFQQMATDDGACLIGHGQMEMVRIR